MSSYLLCLPVRCFQSIVVSFCAILCSILLPFTLAHSYLQLPYFALGLSDLITRLGLCGVVMVSGLGGFGSIEFPYRRLSALIVPVTADQIASMTRELERIEERTTDKKTQLKELNCGDSLYRGGVQRRHSKSRSTGVDFISNTRLSDKIRQLEDEIDIIGALRRELLMGTDPN